MKTQTRNGRYVELLDTTLRDGEQTPGVAFTPAEKFEIARILISHLRIDRLEIGSARVSDGARGACRDPEMGGTPRMRRPDGNPRIR